jgi:hypothetical protein
MAREHRGCARQGALRRRRVDAGFGRDWGLLVRDEAGRAARKGLLVPVLLDKVDPPLGFGETQAIDLTRWRGKVSDPFFQDLVDAARARIAGRPAPAPFGPMKRLRLRLTAGAAASVLLAAGAAFANNVLQVQNRACVAPVAQPGLSDLCGALGLGARPVRDERLAWAAREEGKCDGLRTHLQRFPSGAYRDTAQALLNARSVVVETSWKLGEQPQPLRCWSAAMAPRRSTMPRRRRGRSNTARRRPSRCVATSTPRGSRACRLRWSSRRNGNAAAKGAVSSAVSKARRCAGRSTCSASRRSCALARLLRVRRPAIDGPGWGT